MVRESTAQSLGEIRFEPARHGDRGGRGPFVPSVRPLPAWAYLDPELLAREKAAIFRSSWQIVCHANDVAKPGDYLVFDLLDDSVIVLRGLDGVVRAVVNACRHRASRLLDGQGRCPARLTCPYHGWSYGLDGALKSVPFEDGFPGLDKADFALRAVELEIFHGLVFVRLDGHGPSVAELWSDLGADLPPYRLAEMVTLGPVRTETWDCNWKVAIDNYLESYHVPVGHPGLNRLLGPSQDLILLDSGVTRGVSRLRPAEALAREPSATWSERLYLALTEQARAGGTLGDLPGDLDREWRNYSMLPNLGLDIYPDMIGFFQVLPDGVGRTIVRSGAYGLPDQGRGLRVLRLLNDRINRQVNAEDKTLCERVQRGLRTTGYEPGPLAAAEACVAQLHDYIRESVPTVGL